VTRICRSAQVMGLLSCAILLFTTLGCGTSSEATVLGLVTLDGSIVPGANITFIPSGGGTQAYAMSDESGNYEVYTGQLPGLKPGEYKVTLVARKKPAIEKTESGGAPPAGASITPKRYSRADTSGLSFQIQPGANEINLSLTSEPPTGP
jgi:hypothetical protein